MPKQYYVLKEYSWTDRRCLWRVLTRPLKSIATAWGQRDFEESQDKSKKRRKPEYFIVERLSNEEVERRLAAGEQFNLD